MSWYAGYESICRPDATLAELTWYRLGGAARWLFEPRDEDELAGLMACVRESGVAWRVLGRGANVLVRDSGFDGAVIRLASPGFGQLHVDGLTANAGAACDFPKLIRQTIAAELVGMEVLAGIPGSFGGVVRMNAGGRFGEIGTFVRRVRVLDELGCLVTRPAAEVGFAYRKTGLEGCIVVGAELELVAGNRDEAMARHREIWNAKYASQPAVAQRSAGCIFKNPPGHSAGRLLDEAGLKGTRVGAAEIAGKHANFILAHDGARAQDVIDLAALARDRVFAATGVALQLEVDVW
jgi:UDP-N-acetylmuramate dehydrogenase